MGPNTYIRLQLNYNIHMLLSWLRPKLDSKCAVIFAVELHLETYYAKKLLMMHVVAETYPTITSVDQWTSMD
jgi:hypothetical protein